MVVCLVGRVLLGLLMGVVGFDLIVFYCDAGLVVVCFWLLVGLVLLWVFIACYIGCWDWLLLIVVGLRWLRLVCVFCRLCCIGCVYGDDGLRLFVMVYYLQFMVVVCCMCCGLACWLLFRFVCCLLIVLILSFTRYNICC